LVPRKGKGKGAVRSVMKLVFCAAAAAAALLRTFPMTFTYLEWPEGGGGMAATAKIIKASREFIGAEGEGPWRGHEGTTLEAYVWKMSNICKEAPEA
jgi:hypothetical protein